MEFEDPQALEDPLIQRDGWLWLFIGKEKTKNGHQSSSSVGVDSNAVDDPWVSYPCTFHHTGGSGGLYTLFAKSAQARLEWKVKIKEVMGLRKAVQEWNKVFEVSI